MARRVTVRPTDAPEDVSELVCNNDCMAGTRERNLGRFLRELSAYLSKMGEENLE